MNCLHCGKIAVFELRYSGHWVCRRHFIELFERRVKKTIRQGRLLAKDDFVLVGLSGGAGSMATLKILYDILCQNPHARIAAATINDGIGRANMRRLSDYCHKLGVEHYAITPVKAKGGKLSVKPVIDVLFGLAAKRGATKLATGENLDDEIQDAFVSLISGEAGGIRGGSKASKGAKRQHGRIRVLRECPEEEVNFYVKLLNLPIIDKRISLEDTPYRASAKKFLNDLERNHPGSKFQMLRSIDEFASIIGK
jgi:tRNA(Ile)-lysidine synthase TilS/MesJ